MVRAEEELGKELGMGYNDESNSIEWGL